MTTSQHTVRAWLALTALALPGCRRTSAPAMPAPTVASVATAQPLEREAPTALSARRVDPDALTRACEALRGRSRAVLDGALARESARAPGTRVCPRMRELDLRARFDRCVQTETDAWALELRALSVRGGDTGCDGRWALVHIARDGSETRFEPGRFSDAENHPANLRSTATTLDTAVALAIVDYDGDGTSEALLTERSIDGALDRTHTTVLALRGDAVISYPPAAQYEIEQVRDVDDDGRPDLLHYGPYAASEPTCGGDEHPFGAVLLLAHATPDGRFVDDDGVAISFARQSCGRRPRDVSEGLPDVPALAVVDAGSEGDASSRDEPRDEPRGEVPRVLLTNTHDDGAARAETPRIVERGAATRALRDAGDASLHANTATDDGSPRPLWRSAGRAVACGRMYGLSTGTIERMLARACVGYAVPSPCAEPPLPPGQCPSYLLHWARIEAPLRLR